MKSIACDIVLLPSKPIANLAYAVSRRLAPLGTYFTLNDGDYYAHTSLYMVQLEVAKIQDVEDVLTLIASRTQCITLRAKEYHYQWGYVDVEYLRNEAIDNLQQQVVAAVNPLRDGMRQKDADRLKTATGPEKENLEMYGYRSVGDLFAPHITFTRLKDESAKPAITTDLDAFSGDFCSIALFEMGDNGTCVRKIFEIPLGA